MTAPSRTSPRPVVRTVRQWYRDPVSCLQASLATVLLEHGADPVFVLGLAFEFLYKPGDVRPEEFYYPCRFPGDPLRSLAPYHAVSSRWHHDATAEADDLAALAELAGEVSTRRFPIAAVDNFHLPFRPAYHDVHAAHLLVVCGVDVARGSVYVSDAMPPAFKGAISVGDFLRAWSSVNPQDSRDVFFSSIGIGRRRLVTHIDEPVTPLTPDHLSQALRANLACLNADRDPAGWGGLAGLGRYLDDLLRHASLGERQALSELYTFGWGMQAQAYLHAELLRGAGSRWDVPELREAARHVYSVSSAWTGLRITGAHRQAEPRQAVPELARHAGRLRRAYGLAADAIADAAECLASRREIQT